MYAGAASDFVLGATLLDARRRDPALRRPGDEERRRFRCVAPAVRLTGHSRRHHRSLPQGPARNRAPKRRCDSRCRRDRLSKPSTAGADNHCRCPARPGGTVLPGSGCPAPSSAVRAAHERLGGERVDPTAATQWWNALRHCQHPQSSDNISGAATDRCESRPHAGAFHFPTPHRRWPCRAILSSTGAERFAGTRASRKAAMSHDRPPQRPAAPQCAGAAPRLPAAGFIPYNRR